MADDIAARRLKLLGGTQGGMDPAMMQMLVDAQRNNADLHGVIAEMGQTVRAYAKDINQYIQTDKKGDQERDDAFRAQIDTLNAKLLQATADCARCEGELTALRQAYADLKTTCDAMCAAMGKEETPEEAPRIIGFDVIKDGAGTTRRLKPVYEGTET